MRLQTFYHEIEADCNRPNTLAFVSLFGGKIGEFKTKLHPQHEDKDAAQSEEQARSVVGFYAL